MSHVNIFFIKFGLGVDAEWSLTYVWAFIMAFRSGTGSPLQESATWYGKYKCLRFRLSRVWCISTESILNVSSAKEYIHKYINIPMQFLLIFMAFAVSNPVMKKNKMLIWLCDPGLELVCNSCRCACNFASTCFLWSSGVSAVLLFVLNWK